MRAELMIGNLARQRGLRLEKERSGYTLRHDHNGAFVYQGVDSLGQVLDLLLPLPRRRDDDGPPAGAEQQHRSLNWMRYVG